ncbi:hypothetical protein [Paludisphaera rhizosphaerae]|uniref:hypothetical protein n=1 Tax=Paludisphaera rhizosphaerae TaxID=2711216 RepID=UPI0013EDE384|nr:hypothetical protein [Paludisphaera rhizosphaerae]
MARESARRPRSKAVSAPIAAKVKMSASVRTETYMRLATHALWMGKTQGELIDDLVESGCRRYRVQDLESAKDKAPTDPPPESSDSDDETAAA